MEKIVEKYTMDKVFEVIGKHKDNYQTLISNATFKCAISKATGDEKSCEKYMKEINDYAGGFSALVLLECELKGEVEY